MLCSKTKKRKNRHDSSEEGEANRLVRKTSHELLSPLKSLKLSPIPRCDENYSQMYHRLGLKGCVTPQGDVDPFEYASPADEVLPVLEISEREIVWTGEQQAKMYQPYKGQLKLSVYINYGLLTIHVMQARHLSSKWKDTCDTCVKLSLMPDESRRTRCKTEVILDTNHPVIDEKFSFELLDSDLKKRLLISVWHKDASKGKCEFLGCMSFGVQHISKQKRVVNGWYYLLTEEIGRRKHLQVTTKKQQPLADSNFNKNIPAVNQDVMWMEPHVVVIRRTSDGYGFSLTGASPVKVCRVEPGSTAERSGLKAEDCIVRINSLNVSRSTADSIARIIRHSSVKIVLEIQRPREMSTLENSPRSRLLPLSSTMCWRPQVPGPPSVYGQKISPPSVSYGQTSCGYVNNGFANSGYGYSNCGYTNNDYRDYHGNGHHSDSELEVDTRPKQVLPLCGGGTLPRNRKIVAKPVVRETLC